MSINDNIKFLENIKQGLKKNFFLEDKYICEITTPPKNNNLGYLIVRTFRNIIRSFVLSFKNGIDDPERYSFNECYMPVVEIKEKSRNNDYTTENF